MDLSLSDEQKQLQDAAERFVRDKYAFENRRKIAATEKGWTTENWAQMAELGWLGVPLTDERSIAVDPTYIPLGSPVFLSTTKPLSTDPIQKLVFAQDVGSAIRGAVRADYYFGHGDAAGDLAGRMKQAGRLWVLVPKGGSVGVATR